MNEMRIYVASLSDYNNGRLEGKWLDLADYSDASELMEAIQEMLDDLTKKYNDGEVREEWAVHDYEGIPSTLASEYMGEQDFQQLYDIAEVADDRGIPVEVLVERAGDTGSDDYQALADSLMFVVNGNDESDIVYEYEEQLGGLGNDFWSNHIYVDDVTERVMYGEDVDRFREDILYDNPDMDEDEAERQAEEMADEEAERREDLTTYLEDMGYGDEIPNWVSKDYEGAWKRSLSYDFDVIHHDGEMYVFSNNYGVGGTILSGLVGAYIGYKVGRARPQKKGFDTEKRIGRKIKGAFSKKKKYAKGGGVSDNNANYYRISISENDKYIGEYPYSIESLIDAKTIFVQLANQYKRPQYLISVYRRPTTSSGYEKINVNEWYDYIEDFAKGGGVDDTYARGGKIVGSYTTKEKAERMRKIFQNAKSTDKDEYFYVEEIENPKTELKYDLVKKKSGSTYAKGGGIGFKELSRKVAKRYEGKSVPKEYQKEYGKRYSKSEAKEVGDKVAGKVYWQQQGRKMAKGGGVGKYTAIDLLVKKPYGNEEMEIAKFKGTGDAIISASALNENSPSNYEYSVRNSKKYAQGGGVEGLNDLIRG